MYKYVINPGRDNEREVTAERFTDNGTYTDFLDHQDVLILRLKNSEIVEIKRVE